MNPNKNKILNLWFAKHPKLKPLAERLAHTQGVSVNDAGHRLKLRAHELGLTTLDLEMHQPDDHVQVPFEANSGGEQRTFAADREAYKQLKYGAR